MPFKFPYTNFQELNLDWIIKKVKDLSKQIEDDSSIVSEYIDRLIAVEDKADNAEATATAADARATGANNTANSALTLATQAKQTAEIAGLSTTLLGLNIGDLSRLYTTAKDTIVNAINEVWSIFHNATAVTNVTPAGTDPAVTYSNGVFTFDLPEGGDPDAVTQAELDAAIDDVEDTIDALTDRVDGLEDSIDDLSEDLDNKADVIIDTASGYIASFPDGTATPLKSLVVNVEPVQAGSGDPSPSNVRLISGWNGITVTHTGKSIIIFNNETMTPATNFNGFAGWNSGWKVPGRTGVFTYSAYIDNTNAVDKSAVSVWFRGSDNITYVDGTSQSGIYIQAGNKGVSTITIDMSEIPNTYYLYFGLSLKANGTASNPIVVIGNTPADYEPYNGTVYPVNFNETVYGAEPDIISGEMPITYRFVPDISTLFWQRANNNIFYATDLPVAGIQDRAGVYLKCSEFKGGDAYNGVPMTVQIITEGTWLWICDTRYNTTSEFVEAIRGVQLVYKVANPTETTITPVPVTALKGYNNVWSDAGSVDVTYRADTKGYIDKLIAQVQALALGG